MTKPATKRGDKVKVIKPPMRLDKIIICGLRDVGLSAAFVVLLVLIDDRDDDTIFYSNNKRIIIIIM